MSESWLVPQRTALVLGGGGLKGFAHIGVMRALDERGIVPTRYAGTSIGALIAAARVGGVSLDEMERRAMTVAKRDLFRLNRVGMLMDRSRAPSLYLEQPLRDLVDSVTPEGSFRNLGGELLVNTVDLERGTIVMWGLPGLEDVSIRNAVYASCALPGFFPLSNGKVEIKDDVAQTFVSWRGECKSTIRNSYQILSRGKPNLENEIWNVSSQVLNGTMTPDAAGAQLEDGLKKWYAPHQK